MLTTVITAAIEWTGKILEFSAKYGIIDIFFGVGILAYLRRKLRRRTTDSIDGVQIMPHLSPPDGFLKISFRNNSRDVLYLYRASFRPGYFANRIDTSSSIGTLLSIFFSSWVNDHFPRVTEESRTTRGDFVLQGVDTHREETDELFLEPKEEGFYALGIEEVQGREQRIWDRILERHQCGRLRVHYVHGQTGGILEVQI